MSERYTTDTELAEALGVSTRTVERYRNDGKIPAKKNGKGTPFNRSIQQYVETLKNGGVNELEEEKIRLTRAQANAKEFEVQEMMDKLIPVQAIMAYWQGVKVNIKAKLLNIPTKLAPLVVGVDSIDTIKDTTQELIYEALNELVEEGVPDEFRERSQAIIKDFYATTKINS